MHSHTPDAGANAQRALNELCCARKLSMAFLVLTIVFTVGAVVSAMMDGTSIWQTMPGPLSSVIAAAVLWRSCEQRIHTVRRELAE